MTTNPELRYDEAAKMLETVLVRPLLVPEVSPVKGNKSISRWTNEHPKEFASVLIGFDNLISSWNATDFDPTVYRCSSKLKESLQGAPLPSLLPDSSSISDLRNLYQTIRALAWGMVRGQLPDDGGLRYKFHLQGSLKDEPLVIGAVFHAYEIQLGVQNPKLAVKLIRESGLQKNYVLDPLVEHVLSLETTNPIFMAVTDTYNQGGLDWITDYPAFTLDLQKQFNEKKMVKT